MALYTSYYTRQLALRPENLQGGHAGEDEKTNQKAVTRRNVDYTAPILHLYQKQGDLRSSCDALGIFPTASASLDILPPVAYTYKPATSACIKFAGQAPSKTRSSVNVALWMADSRRCLTATQAGEFCMWSAQSFNFETIIQAHDTAVRSMNFSRSGTILLSGDDDGGIRYWRTNLELVKTAPAHKEAIRQIVFSPTDIKFATASDDSTVRVWDLAYSKTEHILAGHGGDVRCVDWHPTKSLLVSGSKDGLIKLWCARSGESVSTIHGHKGTIMSGQWNMNGNWILTSSRDQTCKVFDIRKMGQLASFASTSGDATCAAWNPIHEDLFVAGGHEGGLGYHVVGRQKPVAEVAGAHDASVWCVAWHPLGHLLTTGGADAAVKFWCRTRPGDPFIDEQQRQQADYAAMAESEPKAKAAAPLYAPAAGSGSAVGGMGIPGIGAAIAAPAPATIPATTTTQQQSQAQPPPQHRRGGDRRGSRWDNDTAPTAVPLPGTVGIGAAPYRGGGRGTKRERSRSPRRDGGGQRDTRRRSPPPRRYR